MVLLLLLFCCGSASSKVCRKATRVVRTWVMVALVTIRQLLEWNCPQIERNENSWRVEIYLAIDFASKCVKRFCDTTSPLSLQLDFSHDVYFLCCNLHKKLMGNSCFDRRTKSIFSNCTTTTSRFHHRVFLIIITIFL
jgi:hypothetical protein